MFIDETKIKVIAGKGGDGCLAFRREKYVPMGGPFGGNGGRGANIKFVVDEGLHTLIDLRYAKTIKGDKGENGLGKNKNGSNAKDVIVKVPQGTIVTDLDTGLIIADLKGKNDEVIVAYGGRGGRGNTAFKTQSNPAPNFAENGEPGEEKELKVELKLMADVGLVGLPSVGKSTIISCVSKAKPKIAAYHFTTLVPNLGVCRSRNGKSFVLADLPGLIEGASRGDGLGDRFLKHIERTRIIAHVIDMSSFEERDPYEDYLTINKELEAFNKNILKKPQIIIANKMDLDTAHDNLEKFKERLNDNNIKIFEVSAITNKGLEDVVDYLADTLETLPIKPLFEDEVFESHVLYKFKEKDSYTIEKEDDVWVIKGDEIEKLFKMTKFSTDESITRFAKRLCKMGIDDKLLEMGAKEGDQVRIMDFYFDFK